MTMLPKQYLLITESWKPWDLQHRRLLISCILAVLRKCNPGKLSGDKQSVSDSQSKKENAKAETLISEMEADLTEDGTKESHSDAPDEDLSIQKETMDKKSAEQEENEGGQEV